MRMDMDLRSIGEESGFQDFAVTSFIAFLAALVLSLVPFAFAAS